MAGHDPERVFITGASSGVGAALARYYAKRGAVVALVARREAALRSLADELGARCEVHVVDVRDSEGLFAAAEGFVARHGCPDLVFANAGVSVGTLTEYAEDTPGFQEVLDTNLVGMVRTFQPFVGSMRVAGRGCLVGIASVAGYRGLPGAGAYSASKAAAISYLESLRVELRGYGIKVITICPGYIATPMTANNPYAMPFLLSADAAAQKIAAIVARGRTYAVIPWQMALVARVLRILPNALFDRLVSKTPRKPRRGMRERV